MACVPELGGGRRGWRRSRACRRRSTGCPRAAPSPRCDKAQDACRAGRHPARAAPGAARALPSPRRGDSPAEAAHDRRAETREPVQDLSRRQAAVRPARARVRAVRPVTLRSKQGETLGIVGESGCGKSTLARMLVGLLSRRPRGPSRSRASRSTTPTRRRSASDPVCLSGPDLLAEPAQDDPPDHGGAAAAAARHGPAARAARIAEIFASVNLREEFLDRYPHEFSGGQAQRIGIARALAAEARILILDEPVSALDVSVQAQVLNLLADLKARVRADLSVHQPRPGGGGGGQRPHRGAVFRRGGGMGRPRRSSPRRATPIHGCWPTARRWWAAR
jgi:ABC-type glutathione transport system ATPase component